MKATQVERWTAIPVAAVFATALTVAPIAALADDVTLSGCPQAGVEAGCIILSAGAGGTVYNITAATPRPDVGIGGTAAGTISSAVSFCQQGMMLAPATWKADPTIKCPTPAPG